MSLKVEQLFGVFLLKDLGHCGEKPGMCEIIWWEVDCWVDHFFLYSSYLVCVFSLSEKLVALFFSLWKSFTVLISSPTFFVL